MAARPYGARLPRNASVEAIREMYRLGKNMTVGNIFYVDGPPYGDNSNDGLSMDSPLLTIRAALDKCVDLHDDYIIVMDCYQQETFPINIDRSRVHILGVSHWGGMYTQMFPAGNFAIFTIDTKGYIEIAYFSLGSGAAHASIEFIGAAPEGRTWIHDCWFGAQWTGQDGIKITGGEHPELMIERCLFGKQLTQDGIRIESASTRTIIRDNIFREVALVGIHVVAINTDLGAIIGNRFSLPPQAAAGAAISIAAGAVGCLIDDNHAMEGKIITTNVPYVDAGGCNWGLNWRHVTVCPPT